MFVLIKLDALIREQQELLSVITWISFASLPQIEIETNGAAQRLSGKQSHSCQLEVFYRRVNPLQQ